MGHTPLQIGRIVMMAFWFTFILLALNMARLAWPTDPQGFNSYAAMVFFLVAAYAGFGMLIGMVARFMLAQDRAKQEAFRGI